MSHRRHAILKSPLAAERLLGRAPSAARRVGPDRGRSYPRRSRILLATSMCFAVLLTIVGSGSAAFGAARKSASPSSVLPPDFHGQSLSWDSPEHGWILGSAPCGLVTC